MILWREGRVVDQVRRWSGTVELTVEVYDAAANAWRQANPLPKPLCAYALTALDEKLYLFGGWDGKQYVANAYTYDPQTDAWNEATPMPVARGFAAAAPLDGRLYVVGGYDDEKELATCTIYEPGTGLWQECAPLTVGRGGIGLVSLYENLYAIGGGISGDWQIVSNEWYDPRQDVWTSFETPFIGQWRNPGVATDGTSVFAVGGWSSDYLAHNEEYRALFRLFLPAAP